MSTLSDLKDYTPQDFKQWKDSGITKVFFQYLRDKSKDIDDLVLAQFHGGRFMDDAERRLYERQQAFSACLNDIDAMDLQSIIDYYEGKEGKDNDL